MTYFSLRAAAAGLVLDGGEFQPMPIFEEPGAGGAAGNGELPYRTQMMSNQLADTLPLLGNNATVNPLDDYS